MSGHDGRRVSRNAGLLLIGTVTRLLFSLGFVMIVARRLGINGFGNFAVTQYYFDFFLCICGTGIGILVTREIAKNQNSLGLYFAASISLVLLLAVLAGFAMGGIAYAFRYQSETQSAMWVAAVALLPAATCLVIEAIFVGLECAEYVTIGTFVDSLLRFGIGVTLLLLDFNLAWLFIALLLSRSATLILYIVCLWRQVGVLGPRFDRLFFVQFVKQWKVFAFENWLSNFNGSIGVILLSWFHGEVLVGMFVAASKVLRLGRILAQSYTTAVFPYLTRLSESSRQGFEQLNNTSLRFMLCSILPIAIAVSVFADRISLMLYGVEFAPAAPVLSVLAWTLVLNFTNPYLSHVLFAEGKPRSSMAVALIRLVVTLAACAVLIPRYAAIGTAIATLVGSSIASGAYFVLATRRTDRKLTFDLIGALFAGAVLALFMFAFRDRWIVATVSAGAVIYVAMLFMLRVITWQDFRVTNEQGASVEC